MNQNQYDSVILRLNMVLGVLLAICFALGYVVATPEESKNVCDMNGDGNFTILDLSILSRVISEK